MKKILVLLAVVMVVSSAYTQEMHHSIYARLELSENEISVIDTLSIAASYLGNDHSIVFELNKNLEVELVSDDYSLYQMNDTSQSNNRSITYKITANKSGHDVFNIPLSYKGKIKEDIKSGAAEYARGFSQTSGIISTDGVYLTGASYWIPSIKNVDLFTFSLEVDLVNDWNVVSQGTRVKNESAEGRRIVKYNSPNPMDEIYLIAGSWTEYEIQSGKVLVQSFLRTPDEKLANKYLHVTSQYLKLYEDLIGPYPFTKFALVENFWETGYGMPSFTLLGEKVIRFPWILHSSYPHELLHNYWGNSVFVDYETGNWCEGITAYMADHLIKEQQGQGAAYRRTTLQKFTDYVNAENDFPICEFHSRNNSAEEAIGYGKTLMFNNMLRDELGDKVFKEAYAKFYMDYKFTHASFDDIRTCFEKVSGQELKPLFDQWINRKGAPSIELSNAEISKTEDQYELMFQLNQVQTEDVFTVNVPVIVYLENKEQVHVLRETMNSRENTYKHTFENRPLKIAVDPEFNVMRRLDHSEVPNTLSQVFGSKLSAIVLPKNSSFYDKYAAVADFWKQTQAAQGKEIEIINDIDINELPKDKPVWVMGFDNKFNSQVTITEGLLKYLTAEEKEKIGNLKKDNSLVYAIPNPANSNQTIGFLGSNNPVALKGLSRKLLHYGKYGYLGFEGSEPNNILKGMFPALNSKLIHVFKYDDNPTINTEIQPRKALSLKQ